MFVGDEIARVLLLNYFMILSTRSKYGSIFLNFYKNIIVIIFDLSIFPTKYTKYGRCNKILPWHPQMNSQPLYDNTFMTDYFCNTFLPSWPWQASMFTMEDLWLPSAQGHVYRNLCAKYILRSRCEFILVLPIDIENPYRLSNCLYRYISIYIGFLATNF